MAAKKTHLVDVADLAKIKEAVSFNVYLFVSPTKKMNIPAKNFIEASLSYHDLLAQPRAGGRKPIIYAIGADGSSTMIPEAMFAEVRDHAIGSRMTAPIYSDESPITIVEAFGPPNPNSDLAITAAWNAKRAAPNAYPIPSDAPASDEPKPELSKDILKDAAAKARKVPLKVVREASVAIGSGSRTRMATRVAAELAEKGHLPAAPDFSAATHAPYRKKLAALVALIEAKDIAGLAAFHINPTSTSPKALARYRDLAIVALSFKAKQGQ